MKLTEKEERNTIIQQNMSHVDKDDIHLEYGELGYLHVRTPGKYEIELLCSGTRTNAKNEEIEECRYRFPNDWMDMFNIHLSLFINEVCIAFKYYSLNDLQVCFNSYDISKAKIDFVDIGKAIEVVTDTFKKYHLKDISEEMYVQIEQEVAKEVFRGIC